MVWARPVSPQARYYWLWNYWVFGLRPSSGILKTTEHNVSETGGIVGDTYSVGSLRKY
jgi:hypothetical protein